MKQKSHLILLCLWATLMPCLATTLETHNSTSSHSSVENEWLLCVQERLDDPKRDLQEVETLMNKHPKLREKIVAKDWKKGSVLDKICNKGDLDLLKVIFSKKKGVSKYFTQDKDKPLKLKFGYTLIHVVCKYGYTTFLEALLKHKTVTDKLNATNKQGETALVLALKQQKLKVVPILLACPGIQLPEKEDLPKLLKPLSNNEKNKVEAAIQKAREELLNKAHAGGNK